MIHEHGYAVTKNDVIMETNNNSAMRSVGEALYRGRTEKEENYISLLHEMKPIYGILLPTI